VFTTLSPGAYTVVVPGLEGTQNIALVEVYDVDSGATPNLLNISTRGFVDVPGNEGMMIAGVIIGGVQGQSVVVRGLGPSLAGSSIAAPLPNPNIVIVDAFGATVGSNDDWQNDVNASTISSLNLGPTSTLEAATLLGLLPGAYTALLSDVNGSSGTGLIEIYNVTSSVGQ
jgi:hypothetical protein